MGSSQPLTPADLGVVFGDLRQRLHRFLQKHVDHDAADDLLQDVFVKALKAIDTNRAPENLAAWLFTAARTTAIDYLRANKSNHVDIAFLEAIKSPQEQQYVERELAECLRALVAQLPEKYRNTLLATEFNSEPMKQVADREGLSVSAIKSRAARGRVMLKDLVLECCEVEFGDGAVSDYVRNSPDCCN